MRCKYMRCNTVVVQYTAFIMREAHQTTATVWRERVENVERIIIIADTYALYLRIDGVGI